MNLKQAIQSDFPEIEQPGAHLDALRLHILLVILRAGVLLGLPAYILAASAAFRQSQMGSLLVFSLLYGILVVLALVEEIPFNVRVAGLLLILYTLGFTSLLENGLSGEGLLLQFFLPVIGTIFLGASGGLSALALSAGTLAIIGWLTSSGNLAIPSPLALTPLASGNTWLATVGLFVLLAAITITSLVILLNSLETGVQKKQAISPSREEHFLGLEQQYQQRTQDLERRLVQIRTAAEINHAIGAVMDASTLMNLVASLIQERFHLYYAGIFLIEPTGKYAVLRAGTGEAGQKMIQAGHKLAVGSTSMIGWSTANRQARIALDVGKEAVRFNNPHLPLTRSELALPILAADRVLGAISVQSVRSSAFDQDDILVLQSIADSLATALENARLFSEVQASLKEIQALHRRYLANAWAELPHQAEALQYTFHEAEESASKTRTLLPLTLRDQEIGSLVLDSDKLELSPEEKSFIEAVSTQAALALENVRLIEETQRRAEHERTIAEITSKLRASNDVNTILTTLVSQLGTTLRATEGLVRLEVEPE